MPILPKDPKFQILSTVPIKVSKMYRQYLFRDPGGSTVADLCHGRYPQDTTKCRPARCAFLGYIAEHKLSSGFTEANPEARATGAGSLLLPWVLPGRGQVGGKRRLWCSHGVGCAGKRGL